MRTKVTHSYAISVYEKLNENHHVESIAMLDISQMLTYIKREKKLTGYLNRAFLQN